MQRTALQFLGGDFSRTIGWHMRDLRWMIGLDSRDAWQGKKDIDPYSTGAEYSIGTTNCLSCCRHWVTSSAFDRWLCHLASKWVDGKLPDNNIPEQISIQGCAGFVLPCCHILDWNLSLDARIRLLCMYHASCMHRRSRIAGKDPANTSHARQARHILHHKPESGSQSEWMDALGNQEIFVEGLRLSVLRLGRG